MTVSAFGLETWQLLTAERPWAAAGYALGSVMTGLLAVTGGVWVAKLMASNS